MVELFGRQVNMAEEQLSFSLYDEKLDYKLFSKVPLLSAIKEKNFITYKKVKIYIHSTNYKSIDLKYSTRELK